MHNNLVPIYYEGRSEIKFRAFQFLGAFAELRKAAINFVMFVRLSVCMGQVSRGETSSFIKILQE
jgi:hypothetical protein